MWPKYRQHFYRWIKLGSLTFIGLLLFLSWVTFVPKIENSTFSRSGLAQDVAKFDWPERDAPRLPSITIKAGSGPTDEGAFKNCRILSLGGDGDVDSYCLLTSIPESILTFQGRFDCKISRPTSSTFSFQLDNQPLLFCWVMPSTANQPIGTLFYLASIQVITDLELKLLNMARTRGWHVVATTVDASFAAPQELDPGEEGEARLATRVDNHLADRAYAVEAMIDFLEQRNPHLVNGPRVLVGMSAGAIAAPSVAARVGPFDAVVIIAGGENVSDILLHSPLFRNHTTLRQPAPADGSAIDVALESDPDVIARFALGAFEKSKLDPARTASCLIATPVLMLHASFDRIVPSRTGRSLYESLGKPERWTFRTGHVGLCLLLQWKAKAILEWIEKQSVQKPQLSS